MCGIAGTWNFGGAPVDRELLLRARDSMAFRGPDDQGCWFSGAVGLAHRRLSIIDLSPGGRQPMVSPSTGSAIVFNGEIYNYRELRAEIEAEGVPLRTASDTEALLEGYGLWGPAELFRKCRGMWALAIWDGRSGKMVLSRDRFGKKPLFYRKGAGSLSFASTLNAARMLGGSGGEVLPDAIDFYLNLGYVPADTCAIAGYSKCPPATFLEFLADGSVSSGSYWTLAEGEEEELREEAWVERIEPLLMSAVRDRLVADVPVSSFLSGGIDSTLVTALMCESGYRPKTFTMTVKGSPRDESARAAAVAGKYGTEHHEIPLESDCVDVLPFLVSEFGEPFGDSSAIPAYYVARKASMDTKVIMTGDGGDEVFGGYGRRSVLEAFRKRHSSLPAFLRAPVSSLGCLIDGYRPFSFARGAGRRLGVAARGLPGYFELWKKLPGWRRKALFGPRLRANLYKDVPGSHFLKYLEGDPGAAWTRSVRMVDIRTNLVGDFLPKIDTSCMSASIEARCPMLDHRLVEEVWRMPLDLWQLGGRPKGFLLRLAGGRLPREVTGAPKTGFSIPVEDFWKKGWMKLSEGLLRSGVLVEEGWIKPSGMAGLFRDVAAGRDPNDDKALYYLLCLELWMRISVNGESPGSFVPSGASRG